MLGFVLLGSVAVSGTLAYTQHLQNSWIKTEARVIGVGTPGTIGGTNPAVGLTVSYDYFAGGTKYSGAWTADWITAPLMDVMAPNMLEELKRVGMVKTSTLPRDVRHALQGESSQLVALLTPEVKQVLAGEDFGRVHVLRRKSLAGILPRSNDPGLGETVDGTPTVSIRYNPRRPSQSVLNYPGFNFRLPSMLALALSALLAVYYSGWTYPRLKRRGY